MRCALAIGVLLGGCSQLLGIEGLRGGLAGEDAAVEPDAAIDARIDAPPPTGQRMVHGKTTRPGPTGQPTPAGGVELTYLVPPSDAVAAMTMSASDGTYQLLVPAGVEGVVRAKGDPVIGVLDTYVTTGPLAVDLPVDIIQISPGTIQMLGSYVNLPLATGLAVAFVRATNGSPVAGATALVPFPLPVYYSGPNATPVIGGNSTTVDGVIWMFDPGNSTYAIEARNFVNPAATYGPRSFHTRSMGGQTSLSIVILAEKTSDIVSP